MNQLNIMPTFDYSREQKYKETLIESLKDENYKLKFTLARYENKINELYFKLKSNEAALLIANAQFSKYESEITELRKIIPVDILSKGVA